MRVKASSLRRKLLLALLVLMTLLPLVVYLYSRRSGETQAIARLAAHVERNVAQALQMKAELEPIIASAGANSSAVKAAMERLVINDNTIAYIQLADKMARVLNSTSDAPRRNRVPILGRPVATPEIAAPEVVRYLDAPEGLGAPEYVVRLRMPNQERGYLLVGVSPEALADQLKQFRAPMQWSSLQIAVICVAILAVFAAYIVRLSERTRILHAQLQEESRLAYIGTLAAGIAHEVRNPLSSMKMNVQMMEKRLDELGDAVQADYFRGKIERIKGEIERLADSVSHFLTFARPAPMRLEASGLNVVVDNVLELLQPQCQSRGVQLVRRYARDLPQVEIDPRQFVQAVQNLVLNALQALGRGGTITVSTEAGDGGVILSVADNGPGIPEDIREKIFEVFFTTREAGTGLGLNIVSRIVEEHRGKLTLESEMGKGTTFRILLPTAPAAPESSS